MVLLFGEERGGEGNRMGIRIGTYAHVGFPAAFEDGHGGEGAGAHGHVWEFVGGTVRVDREELWTCYVDAAEDERCSNVTLVPADTSET